MIKHPVQLSAQAAMLELVLEAAPKLRELGVKHLNIDGMSIELGELPAPAATTAPLAQEDDDDSDALNDPLTFGRRRKPAAGAKP